MLPVSDMSASQKERLREYKYAWYLSHKDKVLARSKEWAEANPEKALASKRAWNQNNVQRQKVSLKRWRENHYEQYRIADNAYMKSRNSRLRQEVLQGYGAKCSCCGEIFSRFLTVNRVDAAGVRRPRISNPGPPLYRKLIKLGFPSDHKILCLNCSCGAAMNKGLCPHKHPTKESGFERTAVLNHYGNACSCCGEKEPYFLNIDHINGAGNQHRQDADVKRLGLTRWLVENGFPTEFRLLCFNCNHGRYHNGGVCPHKDEAQITPCSQ